MAINKVYGFYQEFRDRFNEDDANILWKSFNDLFAYLPLAAIIHGRILCMHGGIGPTLNSLDDIRNIKRPLEEPNVNQLACDLLWADPIIDLKGFVPNTVRGVSVYFGEDAVISLCEKLKIDLIVRAHQMMLNGDGFYCKRKLLTIFSAPRYYPEKNNKGAVLRIDNEEQLRQLWSKKDEKKEDAPKSKKDENNNDPPKSKKDEAAVGDDKKEKSKKEESKAGEKKEGEEKKDEEKKEGDDKKEGDEKKDEKEGESKAKKPEDEKKEDKKDEDKKEGGGEGSCFQKGWCL
uniref:Serine/threonine specific protein phosphatases domain-containing protein n=1 Tax=Panagrolaimus superbus TaxID=310955 RepID=A0A914YWP2_9BILA